MLTTNTKRYEIWKGVIALSLKFWPKLSKGRGKREWKIPRLWSHPCQEK
jgi:hypothetical protein